VLLQFFFAFLTGGVLIIHSSFINCIGLHEVASRIGFDPGYIESKGCTRIIP